MSVEESWDGMKRALMIIDLQKGVCEQNTFFDEVGLMRRVNKRIDDYRKNQSPIIFIQHEDEELIYQSDKWTLVEKLACNENDFYIRKTHANSFYQTDLQMLLEKNKISELEIYGAQTQYCVDATIKFAHGLGYKLFSSPNSTSTTDNVFMTASETIQFYENIWKNRFVQFESIEI